MGKLGSYVRPNSVATALREMGRIEKVIFFVGYLSRGKLRRRIHTGLNKGESMNALARANQEGLPFAAGQSILGCLWASILDMSVKRGNGWAPCCFAETGCGFPLPTFS